MNRHNHPLGAIAQAALMATTLTNTSLVSASGAVPQTAAQTDSPRPVSAHTAGMGMTAARFLIEESGAMIVGADNLSFEAFPSEVENNYVPVHGYLLTEQGTPILELVYLEALSRDRVYEFAFIGGSLKLRGSDAPPIRPIALPARGSGDNDGGAS
jgi:kynurenine formamidase